MTSCTLLDFYSMVVLVSPDFPKTLMKKIFLIFSGKNNDPFNEELDIIPFFLHFSVYLVHCEHFEELEKVLDYDDSLSSVKFKAISLKEFLGNKKLLFEGSIKEDYIFEALIALDELLVKEHMLNTITTNDDALNLLSQANDPIEINLKLLIEKLLTSSNFMYDFFSIEEGVRRIEKKFNFNES